MRSYIRDMSDSSHPDQTLIDLMASYGLKPSSCDTWVSANESYPAFRARASSTLFQVEIRLDEGRSVTENYPQPAGYDMFKDGAFQVYLSSFMGRHNPRFVAIERLHRSDGPWQFLIGLYQREVSQGEPVPVPYEVFLILEDFLKKTSLPCPYHWLSVGVAVDQDGPVAEIRLDGRRQPSLESELCALNWPFDVRDYRLRNVSVVRKA